MIGAHRAIEPALMVDLEHAGHIRRPVVVEGFDEMFASPIHIAKVDEEDLVLGAPLARQGFDVPPISLKLAWQKVMPLTGLGTRLITRR